MRIPGKRQWLEERFDDWGGISFRGGNFLFAKIYRLVLVPS
jgi:hypothetical protein